jgi:hypothetical protein
MKTITTIAWLIGLLCFCGGTLSAQWQQTGLPDSMAVTALGRKGSFLFAGTAWDGVYRSSDEGATWTSMNNGLPSPPASQPATWHSALAFAALGRYIVVSLSNDGLYRSADDGASWQRVYGNYGNPITCLIATDTLILGGEPTIYGGLLRSSDSGGTWQLSQPFGDQYNDQPACFATTGPYTVAWTYSGRVFRSSDGGVRWSEVGGNWVWAWARTPCMVASGQDLFQTRGYGSDSLAKSTDSGESWTGLSIPLIEDVVSMAASPNGAPRRDIFVGGSKIYGIAYYVIGSSDGGLNWMEADAGFSVDARRYVTGGIEESFTLLADESFLFAGTCKGVWRLPLSSWTSVESPVENVPHAFALEQNYPNPFNPSTLIKYTVGGVRGQGPGAGEAGAGGWGLGARKTMLVVYDLLGRQVATLVDEEKVPGRYESTFDGTHLASGVYLYRLTSGSFAQSKTMLLLK